MKITQLPPMLKGSPEKQTADLRNYLVRLVNELRQIDTAPVKTTRKPTKRPAGTPGSDSEGTNAEDIRKTAQELKQLIVKTADETLKTSQVEIQAGDQAVRGYVDGQITSLSSEYLAKSEFGTYRESIKTQIKNTAKETVESYDYDAKINSAQEGIGLLQNYVTELNGQIRRGIMIDPESGVEVLGIAISQDLRFTGEIKDSDGEHYYYLAPGQTLGLYTSTGWQFWINGYRRGWYNSIDGMLHIASAAIENTLQIGAEWQISSAGGLGIKYIGD